MTRSQHILKVKAYIAGYSWRQWITNILLHLYLLLSPTQLAKHFWIPQSFVRGVRIDYLAPSISFLDILSLLILFLAKDKLIKTLRSNSFILSFLYLSLITSQHPVTSLTYLLKLTLIILTVTLITTTLSKSNIAITLFISTLSQSILAVVQFITKRAGYLYILGERYLTHTMPDIAKTSVFGIETIRSYGTFSHPNILAGWSVLVLWIVLKNTSSKKLKIAMAMVTIVLLMLTQSRTASLALIILALSHIKTSKPHTKNNKLFLIGAVSIMLMALFLYISPRELNLDTRLKLSQVSISLFSKHPLFGVGLNSSISEYRNMTVPILQPDHNLITLYISQLGLFGLTIIAYIHKNMNRKLNMKHLFILPLLLFDHYLFTSSQGLFIITLFVYEILNKHKQL